MISKKIKALSAVMAAAVMFGGEPVSAYEHIDGLPTDYVTDVRLNKPYLNFGVKPGKDVDVTDMKFALKDKNGNKIATFTGGGDSLEILDDSLFDFTNIHSEEDMLNYPKKENIPVDQFVPDPFKSNFPYNKFCVGTRIKSKDYSDDNYYIRPYEHCYYYFSDYKKVEVVDTMTLPANTGFVDIDSKFVELNNHTSNFRLEAYEGRNCDIKDYYYFYEHAGTSAAFKADTGFYGLYTSGGRAGGSGIEIYDHPVSYTKVRMKFNDAFPGIADSDLKITNEETFSGEEGSATVVFDLRGDQSVNVFSYTCSSGSVISAPIPDKDGYIEFWVNDEDADTILAYSFDYRFTLNGHSYQGGGGGSIRRAELPKSIEDINFVFEYPQAGFCLYNLEPGDYKLVIDNKGDSRDYRLNKDTITVTDDKKLQRFTATVNKKPLLLGDCNRDGTIDVTDIAIIAAHVKGVKKLDGRGPLTADVDESELINITDVSTIAAHVKGRKLIPEKWI